MRRAPQPSNVRDRSPNYSPIETLRTPNSCHREPLWTEPGWNQHSADEMKIDSFEADRSPGHAYRTMKLAGIFVRERGLFMNPADKGPFYP